MDEELGNHPRRKAERKPKRGRSVFIVLFGLSKLLEHGPLCGSAVSVVEEFLCFGGGLFLPGVDGSSNLVFALRVLGDTGGKVEKGSEISVLVRLIAECLERRDGNETSDHLVSWHSDRLILQPGRGRGWVRSGPLAKHL